MTSNIIPARKVFLPCYNPASYISPIDQMLCYLIFSYAFLVLFQIGHTFANPNEDDKHFPKIF